MKMKEDMMRRRQRMIVTMIRAVMKMDSSMRMTVMMRMGMRMMMRVRMRIMMTLMMRTTKANFIMMMKVMMILLRARSTVYHLPMAKELGLKPHPDSPPKPNTNGIIETETFNCIKSGN